MNNIYQNKYLKYKNKFINLRKQIDEFNIINEDRKIEDFVDPINKNKYLNLQNKLKQYGGYSLSDENPDFILGKLLKIIRPNAKYFDFKDETHKITDFDTTLKFFMENKDYNSIIEYLLKLYKYNDSYKQIFRKKDITDKDGNIIKEGEIFYTSDIDVHPYHINFGALMFLSFIIEIEIFTLFHSLIGYNTTDHSTVNTLKTAFCARADVCSPTRIYKPSVNLSIVDKLKLFAKTLDDVFNEFMKSLVTNIADIYKRSYDEILSTIVPLEHYMHVKDTFDFIYVDWKDRLVKLVGQDRSMIGNINKIIYISIATIENKDANYIAEGTGFFSFIFMNYPGNPDVLFGNCITYSMFELYIMSRLHTNADKMILLVEREHSQPHNYWKIAQSKTKIPALTHFATKFNLYGTPMTLRSAYDSTDMKKQEKFRPNGRDEIKFDTDKDQILKLFIYLIYDMYIQYINSNMVSYNELQIKNINKIMLFIKKRVEEVEKFYPNVLTDEAIKNYLIDESNNTDVVRDVGLDQILSQDNAKQVILGMDTSRLIYGALHSKNYELILKILNFDININIKYNDKTILDMILQMTNITASDTTEIENIIKILIKKGCKVDEPYIVYDNIPLRKSVKKILGIPDLTYEALFTIVINKTPYYIKQHITQELIENPKLIEEINTRRNKYGQSLLYVACRYGNFPFVIMLLTNKGINVNVRNTDNSTPLHGAAYGQPYGDDNETCLARFNIIKLLLKNNADKTMINDRVDERGNRETPYDNIYCKDETIKLDMKKLLKL